MKVNLIALLFLLMNIMGCDNDITATKPLKHIVDGVSYNCDGLWVNDVLIQATCRDSIGNVILIDSIITINGNTFLDGISKSFYPNKQIMKIGEYKYGKQAGVWKKYYPSGKLQQYRYITPDSSFIIYEKNYDTLGELYSLIYPIEMYQQDTSRATVGERFDILIELEYSEYDSVSVVCAFDTDGDLNAYEDTVHYMGTQALYTLYPEKSGLNKLNGILFELDNSKPIEANYGGERKFEFEFFVQARSKSSE